MNKEITYWLYLLRRMLPAAALFFAIETILRVSLLLRDRADLVMTPGEALRMMAAGAVFDLAVFTFFMVPLTLFLLALPAKRHLGRLDRGVTALSYLALIYLLLFDAVSEWVFWDEFTTRFNFIAVDYLVYTHEVLANIWESYPVAWLLAAIGGATFVFYFVTCKKFLPARKPASLRLGERALFGLGYIAIPVALFFSVQESFSEIADSNSVNEASKNGIYSLFSAFRHNELDYNKFYLTAHQGKEPPPIRSLLDKRATGQAFVSHDPDDITRFVPGRGPEQHKNVVIVVMESMSAEYMERFGQTAGLTPGLDRLARESLFFSNAYATGTRTVRGLEAVALSVPPTPGQSIVKRPDNENLSSVGFVFRDRGYDTRFIYGGHGYFDNMNHFFENNGFDIVDRAAFGEAEETFANAWGVCDEDIYNKVLKEADASHARRKPFMHMVMTISNHRPYTFPEGRIDRPSKGGGRYAGVKYADFALGKFLADAKKKPWFGDTVFVIVADHTASSAGKVGLAPGKYHIPLFIYAPGFIRPREVAGLTSQIDIAPTLLGLLDFSYYSKFYGEDALADRSEKPHAFISSYQYLGFMNDRSLVVLRPGRKYARYVDGRPAGNAGPEDDRQLQEAISYYKHASGWRKRLQRMETHINSVN